jgi:hypothetical protein
VALCCNEGDPLTRSPNDSRDAGRSICEPVARRGDRSRSLDGERHVQTITIEETVARRFRLAKAPTLVVQPEGVSPMAFTWLRDEGPFRGRTMAVPPEEAFEFQVALAPMSSGEIWVNGNSTKLRQVSPGDTFVFDLNTNPNGNLSPPYDFLRFISLSPRWTSSPATGAYLESEGCAPRRSASRIRSCRDWRYRFCPCFRIPAPRLRSSSRPLPLRSMLTSYIAMAMGSEAKLPSARGLRLGSCGADAPSSTLIFAAIPRSLTLRESAACPPAILRAPFGSQPAWRPIGGS